MKLNGIERLTEYFIFIQVQKGHDTLEGID
jgi:hypothetical protein